MIPPEQTAARRAVAEARRLGKMVRPEHCEQCGATGRLDAHHDDYSKPLDVRWLCRLCHMRHHAALRPKSEPTEHYRFKVAPSRIRRLQEIAAREQRSLNGEVRYLIDRRLAEAERDNGDEAAA